MTDAAWQPSDSSAPRAARRPITPPWSQRALDLVITVPLLVLLSPVLLAIAVAIKINSRGPALFKQKRIGLN